MKDAMAEVNPISKAPEVPNKIFSGKAIYVFMHMGKQMNVRMCMKGCILCCTRHQQLQKTIPNTDLFMCASLCHLSVHTWRLLTNGLFYIITRRLTD